MEHWKEEDLRSSPYPQHITWVKVREYKEYLLYLQEPWMRSGGSCVPACWTTWWWLAQEHLAGPHLYSRQNSCVDTHQTTTR